MLNPRQVISALKQNIGKVIVGKDEVIELLLIALMCKGHVLLEDVPGTGKTTMVSALAKSLDCSFNRIQFTPDVVPSDVTGFSRHGEFQVRGDGVSSRRDHVSDRAGRRDQPYFPQDTERPSGGHGGISGHGGRRDPSLAQALYGAGHPGSPTTEFVGTYPLPEAQMDRFFIRVSMGYPTLEEEMAVLERFSGTEKPQSRLVPVCSAQDIIDMQGLVGTVYCSKEVRHYIASIAAMTRNHPGLRAGRQHPRCHRTDPRRAGLAPCSMTGTTCCPRTCSAWCCPF